MRDGAYRCDPQVLKACKIRKLYGCDGYYLGAGCRCAKDNQSIMAETEYQELQAYRATGLTVERAAELGKADREGRVLAMPCNVGDTVYVADPDECSWVMCPTVNNVIKHNHIWCVELDFGSTDRFPDMDIRPYPIDGFGKIVFLTREEAEKALEAENHERPDDQRP